MSRPFEGLVSEPDIVAMRELVPAATAPLAFTAESGIDRSVVLCTLLPMAAPALVRQDGTILLGLQVQHSYGDASRELAAVLELALDAEPGVVGLKAAPEPGRRLQDLLAAEPLDVTVHEGFEFWLADPEDSDPATRASLDQANTMSSPTARLTGVEAAYWTHIGSKEHLRWAMPDDEDALLTAFARLHVAGADVLVPGSRLVGMFRAHGILVPVWDLEVGTGPEALETAAQKFQTAVAEALADSSDLSGQARAARAGLANRQVTIR